MANWAGIINMAISAYGAYSAASERKKAAEAAGKSQTTIRTQTPYGQEYIAPMVKYILDNQQKVFESRMNAYGFAPADSTQYRDMLNGVPQGYSGVGMPGAPIVTGPQQGAGQMGTQGPMAAPASPQADPEVQAALGGISAPMGAQGAQPAFQPQAQQAAPGQSEDGFSRYWEVLG